MHPDQQPSEEFADFRDEVETAERVRAQLSAARPNGAMKGGAP